MKDKLTGVVTKEDKVQRDIKELADTFGLSHDDIVKHNQDPGLGPRGGMTPPGRVLLALHTQLRTGCNFFPDSVFEAYWAMQPMTLEMNAPLNDDECWLLRRAAGIPRLELYARLRIFGARGNSKPYDWDEVTGALLSPDGCPRYPSVARQLQESQQ